MKADIHPTYHDAVTVKCACGNTFTTGSTTDKIEVEICANCHPFYTGKSKLMDTAGRVDKFNARIAQAQARQATVTPKKPRKNEQIVEAAQEETSDEK